MAVGPDYVAAIRAAGAIYWPLATAKFRPRKWQCVFRGIDLSAATFAAQVRTMPDAGGAALLTFSCSAALAGADTWLTLQAAEADINALPAPPELGRNAEFYWDCNMTPAGDVKRLIFAGEFIRIGGVTQ